MGVFSYKTIAKAKKLRSAFLAFVMITFSGCADNYVAFDDCPSDMVITYTD